jgi:chromate transporter
MHLEDPAIPHQPLGALFRRFLRFGFLAWGGPVAQIAMIKRELVEEERWITPEKFNRVYAVYQILPGPEAHELCVYFGTLARGRIGGLLAGLGFMLPGLVLMLGLSWVYVRFGLTSAGLAAVFAGMQAGVLALIVRAVHRIGIHALTDRFLMAIAIAAAVATLTGVHFAITLVLAGVCYEVLGRKNWVLAGVTALALVGFAVTAALNTVGEAPAAASAIPQATASAGLAALFGSGLRSGLLTFGGAYTVIPFLLHDSVQVGGWLTHEQFLDGVALGGVLPAPLIIFATFVGFVAAGLVGALVLTAGIFLPAFGFTMLGHEFLERVTNHAPLQRFLAGLTAGVVGLISATTVTLAPACITGWKSFAIFAIGLFFLYRLRAKWTIPAVVAGSGAAGYLLFGLLG